MGTGFRGISIRDEDFEEYERLRTEWSKLHDGIEISMAELFRVAIKAYKRELEG